MMHDPNIEALETISHAILPLLDKLVLVGGCAVGLLISDSGRSTIRPTLDVDLITEVAPLVNYYKLCDELRNLGFREEEGGNICTWKKGGMLVDVMPIDEKILGFTNYWYPLAVETSTESRLPSGIVVRHVTAPLFVATKIESFHDRGNGDFTHHDIEDVITLVDGRPELIREVRESPEELRSFIAEEIDSMLSQTTFTDAIPWLLKPDASEQARAPIILERLRTLAGF